MTKGYDDKPINWDSVNQLSQHPNILKMFLDILRSIGINLYAYRVILVGFCLNMLIMLFLACNTSS